MFHCCVRGVSKGSLDAIRFVTGTAVGVMPAPGFDSWALKTCGLDTNGGLTNAFCRKIPTSGWSK